MGLAVVSLTVFSLALLRMPMSLMYEEPFEFWDRAPTMGPLAYIVEPWAGYLQVFARAAFLVAYPFGEGLGPLVTRLLAAGVIAALAGFTLTAKAAVPSLLVRILTALALPLLPTGEPGPYIGPLNSQWWIAALVLVVALAPVRWWHYPVLVASGLSGVAPCLAWPAIRDRRVVALFVPAVIEATFVIANPRPIAFSISPEFITVAIALIVVMAAARLPLATRLAFTYLGLAILILGSIRVGGTGDSDRYLAVAWIGIALGASSLLVALADRARKVWRERRGV